MEFRQITYFFVEKWCGKAQNRFQQPGFLKLNFIFIPVLFKEIKKNNLFLYLTFFYL